MDNLFHFLQIVTPIVASITMFGVGYGLTQLEALKKDMARHGERLSGLEAALSVRVEKADSEHHDFDRRIGRLEKLANGRLGL